MKKINILLVVLLAPFIMWSQQGINYQAAVRDGAGALLINQAITADFEILETSAVGAVVYSESHTVNTNAYGLINVVLGQGSVVSGVFADIDWGGDLHFLNITIDGNNLGAVEFNSVPYAYHAQSLRNVKTNTPRADVQITSSDEHTILTISPEISTVDDTSTLFFGEGTIDLYGMGITYDGVFNELSIYGSTPGFPHIGPHMTIERDTGKSTFAKGVVVEQTTNNPDVNRVYGNSGPLAYGSFGGTTILADYGITSITQPATGVYTIVLDNDWVGDPVVNATSFNNGLGTEVITYSTSGTNTINVRIVDENNTATSSNFSLVVYGIGQ
ncbi:MAG: hypothetical protein HRT57_09360 [Crocinitomicaceae bacterium]|nr:hypothetical protein [Crocinitomicaceae bacterium]